jgi:hypothetical protein
MLHNESREMGKKELKADKSVLDVSGAYAAPELVHLGRALDLVQGRAFTGKFRDTFNKLLYD